MNFNKQRRNFTFSRPSVERSVSPRERSASPRSSSPAPSLSTIAKEVKWSNKFRLSFAPTPKPIVNDVHSSGHSSLATVNNGVNETILDNTNPFLSRSPTLAELSKGPFVKTPSPKVAPVAMSDFLSRESEILGGEFAKAAPSLGGDEIDFDRAASAFPDISLDGTGDIPTPVVPALSRGATQVDDFGFDDFTSAPPVRDVKITGGDEIDRFEDQFPDLDGGAHVEVSRALLRLFEYSSTTQRHIRLSSSNLRLVHKHHLLLARNHLLLTPRLSSINLCPTKTSPR